MSMLPWHKFIYVIFLKVRRLNMKNVGILPCVSPAPRDDKFRLLVAMAKKGGFDAESERAFSRNKLRFRNIREYETSLTDTILVRHNAQKRRLAMFYNVVVDNVCEIVPSCAVTVLFLCCHSRNTNAALLVHGGLTNNLIKNNFSRLLYDLNNYAQTCVPCLKVYISALLYKECYIK